MRSVEQSACQSGSVNAAPYEAYGQERVASAEKVEGASAQVNVASVGEACLVTFGQVEAAGELLDTSLTARVERGMREGQSQDPVKGKQREGSDQVVH